MTAGEVFLRPEALLLALAAPLFALVVRRIDARRRRRTEEILGPRAERLAPQVAKSSRPFVGATAILLTAGALAQPVWGEGPERIAPRGADVVVCLDVSRSMLAQDEAPTRRARAQREIRELAERAQGDRMGLVVFAGEARLLVPLTRDLASFSALAAQADPTAVGRGGTDLGGALTAALRALPEGSEVPGTVLLLTDGEDLAGTGLRAAADLRERGVVVHCVALGSAAGAKIAVGDGGAFLRAPGGDDVLSSMDPAGLRRIAAATGGEFVEAAAATSALAGLHERRIAPLARGLRREEERRESVQRFQGPLLGAFLLWVLVLGRVGGRSR